MSLRHAVRSFEKLKGGGKNIEVRRFANWIKLNGGGIVGGIILPHERDDPKRRTALLAVREDGELLEEYPEYGNDREIVLAAVGENEYALDFAHESLQNDAEFMVEAVKNNFRVIKVIQDINPKLLEDHPKILSAAVEIEPRVIDYVVVNEDPENNYNGESIVLEKNPQIAIEAVTKRPDAYLYLPESMLSNEEIIKAIKSNHPGYFETKFKYLWQDRKIPEHLQKFFTT